MNMVRVLLSLTTNVDQSLHQLDIKNLFLNGELEEDVYMQLPLGFENSYGKGNLCKLKRSLYGLKQSPRAWFDRFSKSIKDLSFSQSRTHFTLFFKHSMDDKILFLLCIWMILFLLGMMKSRLDSLKHCYQRSLKIKDLGPLRYFLGMEWS